MSALTPHLIDQITQNGPLSIADYMQTCLIHPRHGYYSTRDPFGGNGGDFITAPEISQMFGEMVGLCLAQAWLDQGAPRPFTLAELGPGRGTLMRDILHATRTVPGFVENARVTLIERSPHLRAQQRALLGDHITHLDHSHDLPDLPLFLIANEFFDALPIRQFQRGNGAIWHERVVGVNDGALCLGLSPPCLVPDLGHRVNDTKTGDVVETCPDMAHHMPAICDRIQNKGAALIIDYGDWRSLGDTLQAIKAHEFVDVLHAPGQCDLTAHVDFEAIAKFATGVTASAMTPQGVFLERLGITPRAQQLATSLSGAALDQHIAAHRRLTHPDEMGNLFKVMSLTPINAPLPAGLTTP